METAMPTSIGVNKRSRKREEWEINDDLQTLVRAEEIKKDKARMADVKKLAKKKIERMQSLSSIAK